MKIKEQIVENDWKQFTLINNQGMIVQLLDYGGIITNISTPNKYGDLENIVLSYEDLQDYTNNQHFFGALIGPIAGRIENAQFTLDDKQFTLEKNEGNHHLHSGQNGLHQVIWDASSFQENDKIGVNLSYTIKDEADNLPGNRQFQVTYSLTNDNELNIHYSATTDKMTYMTLTNHTYFNLSSNPQHSIHEHQITIASNQFAELNEELIPTGKIIDVTNTPFDFTMKRTLGNSMQSTDLQNQIAGNGFDHYFIFNPIKQDKIIVEEPISGRTLNINTNQPGMVMYTANNLDEGHHLDGGMSKQYGGICFETQASPAAIFHNTLPSILLHDGEKYEYNTTFSFGVIND